MNRAFTLIEILVVVSIISMLSSIVIASVAPARAQARDAARIQQIGQLNNAIQLYTANKGYAPELTGCQVQEVAMQESEVISGCIAVSTQGVSAGTPWKALQDQLAPYMPVLPSDPCSTCVSGSEYPLGYTYVSPAAMQYYCTASGDCTADNSSYQVYAALERNTSVSGSSSGGGSSGSIAYYPPPEEEPLVSTPTNLRHRMPVVQSPPGVYNVSIDWTPSVSLSNPTIPLQDYYIYLNGNLFATMPAGTGNTIYTVASPAWVPPFCWTVKANDAAMNFSDMSTQKCYPPM